MRLKRSQFFAFVLGLIPGLAKAQLPTGHRRLADGKPQMLVPWEEERPKPNQCPACTTMAEPFHRPTYHKNDGYEVVPGSRGLVREVNPREVPYGPTEHLVRCPKCNNAFYQDAE